MNISPSAIKNILLVRTDRIGDVVLSLPMLPVLKRHFPNAKISIMVRKYTKELVEHHSCVDEVILWESNGKRSLIEYVRLLRSKNFDVAILPYPRFNLSLIAFLAGIPVRVGTGYRWYSFLFNKKVFEHRKDAKRHEVEYNLNLLKSLEIEKNGQAQFELYISKTAQETVNSFLSQEKIERFAVLHAGSGGSARDWPLEKFARLADVIQSELHLKVILTGSENEVPLINKVVEMMKSHAINFAGKLSLQELGALCQRAAVFVSNSTGPLHIASVVGTPVVAFYPPIIQCSPVRWGPYTDIKKIFTANSSLCELCKGGPCQSNVCMNQITVAQVMAALKELIDEHR